MIWKKKTLGDLCHIEKGKIGIQKATPGEFPLVVTAEERLSHNEYHFEGNAVIIPLVSSTGHGHKSLKRIHFQSGKFAVGNILCAVIPKDETVLRADYLYRFLDLNREKELVSRMKGMANVTLPMKEIAKVEIPIPPIETQIDFVQQYAVLEEKSNDLGEEITHQLDLVQQLRQAFLREAMQGKLVSQDTNDEPASVLLEKIKAEKERLIKEKKIKKQKPLPSITEEEIPFEIPENWVWCRLGTPIYYADNLDIQKHLNPSELINYIDIDAIDNKRYCIREAKQKRVEELSSRARRVLKNGFIVYSTVRPYLKNIAIVEDELHNMIGTTGFNVFKPIQLETKFLFYFLLNPDLNVEYERMMIGFNSPSITNTQFENTLLPIPPKAEQQRIVAKLDELMAYCDELEESIKESQQQNELLLQQVLREALEPKEEKVVNTGDFVENLFGALEVYGETAHLQQAAIAHFTKKAFDKGRGKVYHQKTSANAKHILGANIPYEFSRKNYGEFSPQLSSDLDTNPFLHKVESGSYEVYEVTPKFRDRVDTFIKQPEQRSFVKSIKALIKAYQDPLIKGETDRVELLNTVCSIIIQDQITDLASVRKRMAEWKIEQEGYKTKADKFKETETLLMLNLVHQLGWLT